MSGTLLLLDLWRVVDSSLRVVLVPLSCCVVLTWRGGRFCGFVEEGEMLAAALMRMSEKTGGVERGCGCVAVAICKV